jgi:DNA-binding NtrC family response regulator
MPKRILIVDDEPVQRRLLEAAVTRMGFDAVMAEGGAAALNALDGGAQSGISVVILDLVMPDIDGMTVLAKMRERGIQTPVIVQTGQGGIDTVISAMRAGAFDFAVKPVSPERLLVSINNALKVDALEGEVQRIKRSTSGLLNFSDIVTQSPSMDRVLRLGEKASQSNIPIIIEGESGVGKEIIARAIQGSSKRRGKPFITVNCGAIPENLVESVLFGHEKGSFTGAVDKHLGKFVEADGGTLFLDEIGDLPLDAQVKLLRAIQEGEVDPVGGRKTVKVDIRLISATHRNLLELVKEGRFREDLYYRLNVFPIFVPPLRDRKDDIPGLARHFMTRFAAEEGRKGLNSIHPQTAAMLQAYAWPGNVRQMENAVFRAVVLSESNTLMPSDFPQVLTQVSPTEAAVAGLEAQVADEADFLAPPVTDQSGWGALMDGHSGGGFAYADGIMRQLDSDGNVRQMIDMEEEIIRFTIAHYKGQMSEVARRLGIGRSTLYRKLKDFGIDVEDSGKITETAA